MIQTKWIVLLLLPIYCLGQTNSGLITCTTTDIDSRNKEINITFTVAEKDFIYKDFISCSVDNPAVILSSWKADKPSIAHYDSSFKEAKQVFNEDVTISVTATANQQPNNPLYLYCSYYKHSEKKINIALFPLTFNIASSSTQEHIDTNVEVLEYDKLPLRTKKKSTFIDNYIQSTLCVAHTIIAGIRTDHKKYFALLIFLIITLIAFLYFFKKELQKQIKIKELIEIIISLLVITTIIYTLLSLHKISTPLITMIISSTGSLSTGLFYIKKSTKLQSARLRTFCTFIGFICICSGLFFAFKALQYADDKFNLLKDYQ